MRILFITNFHQLYGANRSLLSIVEKFKKEGCEVCVLLPRKGDFSRALETKGINHLIIPYFSQLFYIKFAKPYLLLPFLVFATFCILPYIIYKIRKYNPTLIYSNSCADNIGIIIAKVLKKKHITHIRDFMDLDHRAWFIFGKKAKRNYISKSDAVIYVSKSVAYHTLMSKDMPTNHKVIYNGVSMPEMEFKVRSVPETINFGIVGLLDESKGQDMAIRYFNKIKDDYPNAKLHIWGDKAGTYKKKLHELIEKLCLQEHVIMHGFEKDTFRIYNNMHALLMCSKAEGFGRVTVEAMMRGIPVLGYNSGGTAEIVIHGFNGYVFNTEEEFINNVHLMFSSDDNYNTLCLNAFTDSHKRFSEELYTNNVKDFIVDVMELQ